METSEPKLVNSILNIMGVEQLRLEGLHKLYSIQIYKEIFKYYNI